MKKLNILAGKLVAWAKEYKADCDEYHRTHENQMFYIKKYWYIVAMAFAIPVALTTLTYKLISKKDELERKLEEERRIDKKHYRVR